MALHKGKLFAGALFAGALFGQEQEYLYAGTGRLERVEQVSTQPTVFAVDDAAGFVPGESGSIFDTGQENHNQNDADTTPSISLAQAAIETAARQADPELIQLEIIQQQIIIDRLRADEEALLMLMLEL